MSLEFSNLLHSRILPYNQLILRISMARYQLLVMGRPLDSTHLRFGIHAVDVGPCSCIPDAESAVSSPTPRCQEVRLPWTPGESFHGCYVMVKTVEG